MNGTARKGRSRSSIAAGLRIRVPTATCTVIVGRLGVTSPQELGLGMTSSGLLWPLLLLSPLISSYLLFAGQWFFLDAHYFK
jgi:hypothetical protein